MGAASLAAGVALLEPKKELVTDVRKTLGGTDGTPRLLSVGVAPTLQVSDLTERIGERARIRHVWEITSAEMQNGVPVYRGLDVMSDTSHGLTRSGVLQLALSVGSLGAPTNDLRVDPLAGARPNAPPRVDDAHEVEFADRRPLVADGDPELLDVLVDLAEPVRVLLQRLDALGRQARQKDVSRHSLSSSFGCPTLLGPTGPGTAPTRRA